MSVKGAVMVPHPPLIIPDVGRGEEKKIQATIDAYHEAARMIASWKPDTVVVLSPHSVMYADYFHISPGKGAQGDFGQFRAPQVKVKVQYDTEFVNLLSQEADARELPAGTMGERNRALDHGTLIPLWFLNHYYTDYQAVQSPAKPERLSARCRLSGALQRQMCAWGLFWKGLHRKQQGMENGQAAACLHKCKSFPRLLVPFPPLLTPPRTRDLFWRWGLMP